MTHADNWSKFYANFHAYLQSKKYQKACTSLFAPKTVNPMLCGSLATEVRKFVLQQSHESELDQPHQLDLPAANISVFAHGKVRYVGGRAIAKTKHRNMNLVRNELQSVGVVLDHQTRVKVILLQHLTISQADVSDSKYPDSLIDTSRRQNLSCGLTNISDNTFEFFLKLEQKRLPYYDKALLQTYGQDILTTIHNKILADESLFSSWTSLFCTVSSSLLAGDTTSDNCESILSDIVEGKPRHTGPCTEMWLYPT